MPPLAAKTFTTGLRPSENHTTALRASEMHPPLVAGATTLPVGKHITGFSVAYGSLRIQFLCHPRSSVGRQKESALMGRLGALLRPTWRSYAGPPQWHYKAPLCCELLMKGLLFRALFFPLNRGKSGAARIGGGERSEPVSRMLILPYDTESKSRNADFISIAAERQSATLGAKGPRQT